MESRENGFNRRQINESLTNYNTKVSRGNVHLEMLEFLRERKEALWAGRSFASM